MEKPPMIENKNIKQNSVSSIKLMMPRDVQNANSLIFSQINLNKYSWEIDGQKILNNGNFILTKEDKRILKFLFLKKSPESIEMRIELWLLTSEAKREMINYPNYFKNITDDFPESIHSPYAKQIELDLNRTYPNDPYFQIEANINCLRRILLAYSRRNISIGYCQGFNFIVGQLLKVTKNEEITFWLFAQIVENILPLNFFSNMAGVMVDSAILFKLLEIYIPDLHDFFISNNFEMHLNNIFFRWFASIFSNSLPEKLSVIIWDAFFLDGSIILFKAAIGILKSLKKDIMSKTSLEDIINIFENEAVDILDSSKLMYYLFLRRFEFNFEYIQKNRDLFRQVIIETFFGKLEKMKEEKVMLVSDCEQKKIRRKDVKVNSCFSNLNCNIELPLCVFDIYYKYEITNFFVFKCGEEVTFIEEYFNHNFTKEINNKIILKGNKSENNENEDEVIQEFLNYNSSYCTNDLPLQIDKDIKNQNNLKCKNISTRSSLFSINNHKIRLDMNDEELESHYFLINSDNILNYERMPAEKENILFNKYKRNLNKNSKNLKDVHRQEKHRLKIFENLLIERRRHYCFEIPADSPSELSNEQSKENKIKSSTNSSGESRHNHNNSFTAIHPYFNSSLSEFKLNENLYSNLISDLRKSVNTNEEHYKIDSQTFNFSKSCKVKALYNVTFSP